MTTTFATRTTAWALASAALLLTAGCASTPPDALKRALARAAGASDFAALEARMLAEAARVKLIFDRMIPSAEGEGGEAAKRA